MHVIKPFATNDLNSRCFSEQVAKQREFASFTKSLKVQCQWETYAIGSYVKLPRKSLKKDLHHYDAHSLCMDNRSSQ